MKMLVSFHFMKKKKKSTKKAFFSSYFFFVPFNQFVVLVDGMDLHVD